MLDASYWRRQAREPVAFRACIETLAELGVDAVVEIGPHSVLGPMTVLAWPESAEGGGPPATVASLEQPHPDVPATETEGAFVAAVAQAYEAGLPIRFEGLFAGESRRRISLPGYPSSASATGWRRRSGAARPRGTRCSATGTNPRAARSRSRPRCSVRSPVARRPPGVRPPGGARRALRSDGGIGLSRREGRHVARAGGHAAPQPARLPRGGAPGTRAKKARKVPDGRSRCCSTRRRRTGTTRPGPQPGRSGRGMDRPRGGADSGDPGHPLARGAATVDLEGLKADLAPVDVPAFYRAKAGVGIDLGPSFRTLERVWSRPGEALGEVSFPEAAGGERARRPPAPARRLLPGPGGGAGAGRGRGRHHLAPVRLGAPVARGRLPDRSRLPRAHEGGAGRRFA